MKPQQFFHFSNTAIYSESNGIGSGYRIYSKAIDFGGFVTHTIVMFKVYDADEVSGDRIVASSGARDGIAAVISY